MQKLATALVTFRDKIETVKKDANNPFYKSKYADLPSILDGIKQPLKESGLAIVHSATNTVNGFVLITTLIEKDSGESISSEFPIHGSKPQEVGSSITYARRYNLLALLDIPTDDDDDGNTANTAERTKLVKQKELIEFIEEIRAEKDTNHIKTLYEQASKIYKTEKQIAWLKQEARNRTDEIEDELTDMNLDYGNPNPNGN